MRNIDLIREVTAAAAGNWPYVLAGLSIDVPDSSRRHAPALHVAVSVSQSAYALFNGVGKLQGRRKAATGI